MLIRSALGVADKRRIQEMLFANNGGDLRQQLLDGSLVFLPLTHTAVPTRGSLTPSFTRATTETGQKWDEAGYLDFTALAGEMVFKGARRVRNLLTATESVAAWTVQAGASITDLGGGEFEIDVSGAALNAGVYIVTAGAPTIGRVWVGSMYIKAPSVTGDGAIKFYNPAQPEPIGGTSVTLTSDYQRASTGAVTAATGTGAGFWFKRETGKATLIRVKYPQLEDVTGQADQTASEYVSVGATSGNNYGTELVSNGTFDTATTSWTASNLNGSVATLSSVGGRLRITNNAAGGRGAALQTITLVSGKSYTFTCQSWTGTSAVTSAQVRLGTTPDAFNIGLASSTADGQTLSFNFTASGTTAYLTLDEVFGDASEYIEFDDVSIKENLFHGSMVDGVKCFDTDRSGNPISTTTTYDAVTLNGIAGTYVSTPDSVANSITGDFQFIAKVSAYAAAGLCGKDDGLTERSYALRSNGVGGTLSFFWWPTGASASETGATSTASTGIASGVDYWVKQTLDVDNGAGGWTVKFFTSTTDTDDPDSVVWSQVGADVTGAGVTSLFNSTTPLVFGAGISGQATHNGRIYSAQIYNGINGTLAVDFDASRYAGGTTLTGSTGETWTLNGSAVIHPTNYPLVGYVPWEARTNKVTYSEDFTNWTDSGAAVTANTHTSPNGQTTADTLTRVAGAGDARFIVVSFTGDAAKAVSVWVKKGTSPSSLIALLDSTAAAYRLWCDLTWSGNTPVTAFTNGSLIEAEEYPNNLWRLKFLTESVVAANANRLYVYPGRAGSANGQTVILFGGQGEDAISVGPYIPTTTVAVARNASLLTYTGADVANIKTLAATFSRGVGVATTGVAVAITDGTTNNYLEAYLSSASTMRVAAASGGVGQGDLVTSNAYTPGQTSKIAATNSLNASKRDFDGVAQTEDTTYTPPTVTQINVGHVATLSVFNGPVNHIYGWTRNFSQSELAAVDR